MKLLFFAQVFVWFVGTEAFLPKGLLGNMASPSSNVALKIVPSRRVRLGTQDLESIMYSMKREVARQFQKRDEEDADSFREVQKNSNGSKDPFDKLRTVCFSAWNLYGAPVFQPNQEKGGNQTIGSLNKLRRVS
eukprot:GHVN01033024.1.p1 GENE.GHVN01033024.1~~GHVN01033024.1.p1  ORF type:complete len:134 (-),score=4.59 GHVN01033024.1:460-861(-)